jgi:hypothetical protein
LLRIENTALREEPEAAKLAFIDARRDRIGGKPLACRPKVAPDGRERV